MKFIRIVALLVMSFATTPAWAVLITGVTDPANNQAEWTALDGIISIKNVSNFDARITAMAFNLPDLTLLSYVMVTGTLGDGDWSFVTDQVVSGDAAGNFRFGATTKPPNGNASMALLGGNANSGIDVDHTGIFNFGILLDLTLATDLFVRFQQTGEEGEDSDRGRICTGTDCDPPGKVPEPSIIALFGLGLLGLGLARRRMRS